MRNYSARVALGACLVVASATAQAPATSSNTATTAGGTTLGEAALGEVALGEVALGKSTLGRPTVDSTVHRRQSGDSWSRDGRAGELALPSFGERVAMQDDVDYTLQGQFRLHHGEFMDRRERFDPSVELRARALPNQRVGDEPGTFDLLGYDADIEFPVVITTEAYLLFGLYQYGRSYNSASNFGTDRNPSNWPDETLTAAGLRLGFGWFLGENVLLEVETNPGVYSDFDGPLKSKDYDFPSSALVSVRALDNFFFKFGARYNQVYEDAPWLPWLGFSWEVMEGFRIDLLAPEMVEFSWWPNASTSLAFGVNVQGAQYHVRSSPSTGKQRDDLQIQEVITYVGWLQRFSDNFSLNTRVGAVVGGDYNLNDGQATWDTVEGALRPGLYADITFGINW